MTTRERMKAKALKCLKTLRVATPYIEDFEKNGKVNIFEKLYGYALEENEAVAEKLIEVEEKYHALVYAVVHSELYFGDCYNFLFVPDDPDEWDYIVDRTGFMQHNVVAYVWNMSYEDNSEAGTITCLSGSGGLSRAA